MSQANSAANSRQGTVNPFPSGSLEVEHTPGKTQDEHLETESQPTGEKDKPSSPRDLSKFVESLAEQDIDKIRMYVDFPEGGTASDIFDRTSTSKEVIDNDTGTYIEGSRAESEQTPPIGHGAVARDSAAPDDGQNEHGSAIDSEQTQQEELDRLSEEVDELQRDLLELNQSHNRLVRIIRDDLARPAALGAAMALGGATILLTASLSWIAIPVAALCLLALLAAWSITTQS